MNENLAEDQLGRSSGKVIATVSGSPKPITELRNRLVAELTSHPM